MASSVSPLSYLDPAASLSALLPSATPTTLATGGVSATAEVQAMQKEGDFQSFLNDSVAAALLQPATGVIFTRMAPGAFVDWHNAPRRQYVITLAGGVEIGLGNGSLHRFGPGEGILAEDLMGKGHTTRAVGDEPRVMMIVPLKD